MKPLSVLTFLLLCSPHLIAQEPAAKWVWKPDVMSVYIGGFNGPSYEITYDRRDLRYYAASNQSMLRKAKPVVVAPTEKQWEEFFAELERLKVWDWKKRYVDPQVADGTTWHALIVYGTSDPHSLVSYGSNANPPDFDKFLAAVRKLVGGKEFK